MTDEQTQTDPRLKAATDELAEALWQAWPITRIDLSWPALQTAVHRVLSRGGWVRLTEAEKLALHRCAENHLSEEALSKLSAHEGGQ